MADYIDREAVMTALKEREQISKNPDTVKSIRNMISKLPSADVKPVVHGQWLDDGKVVPLDKDGNTQGWARCSVCGDWLTGSDEYATRGSYCPNCGSYNGGGLDG